MAPTLDKNETAERILEQKRHVAKGEWTLALNGAQRYRTYAERAQGEVAHLHTKLQELSKLSYELELAIKKRDPVEATKILSQIDSAFPEIQYTTSEKIPLIIALFQKN